MTQPMEDDGCTDPASAIINAHIAAMKMVFDPASVCPPDGGGSTTVRFFAGEGIPMEAWDAHNGDGCDNPFLWVRLLRRYRTREFPSPALSADACNLPRALAIEIGVGRCAVVESEPDWDDYAREAEIALDDSWRIEKALCAAAGLLRAESYVVAIDTVAPYGPEGGVLAWTGASYVQF